MYAHFEKRLPYAMTERRELRAEWRRQFGYVFDDCLRSLQQDRVVVNEEKVALASVLGVTTALSGISLDKLTAAWGDMFDVLLTTLPDLGVGRRLGTSGSRLALRAVNRSITERNRTSACWHERALTRHLEKVQSADRKRTARELHDWFGGNISVALRKLELYHLEPPGSSGQDRHLADLHSVLSDLYEGARRLSSGLRLQAPVANIDRELRTFVDSFGFDVVDVTVFVDGDESEVPPHVRDEVFMVLREGLRNIFTHSGASKALVMLQLSRERICGVVQDDGRGFAAGGCPPDAPAESRMGTGIISMKERITTLGGRFWLSSTPGNGTRIAFVIGERRDRSDRCDRGGIRELA
jgi:signal transduction histidine kinase